MRKLGRVFENFSSLMVNSNLSHENASKKQMLRCARSHNKQNASLYCPPIGNEAIFSAQQILSSNDFDMLRASCIVVRRVLFLSYSYYDCHHFVCYAKMNIHSCQIIWFAIHFFYGIPIYFYSVNLSDDHRTNMNERHFNSNSYRICVEHVLYLWWISHRLRFKIPGQDFKPSYKRCRRWRRCAVFSFDLFDRKSMF